jgi:hypothetical protein
MDLPYVRYMPSSQVVANNFNIEEIEVGIRYIDSILRPYTEIQSIRFSERFSLENLGIGYYNDGKKTIAYFSTYEAVAIKNKLLAAIVKKSGNKWKKI